MHTETMFFFATVLCIWINLIPMMTCNPSFTCDHDDINSCNILNSIPCGRIVSKNDEVAYAKARTQYASVSSPTNTMPSMIVFAECDEDITTTVQYARQNDYKLVMRSGGHQYSGLSSCNSLLQPCIQLDLGAYNTIEYDETLNQLKIGAGTKLGRLNHFLRERALFVPHGDCKNVAIGGHFQGGGQGHIHNQFGLLSDHVTGFDIFLANGSLVEVRKPSNWQVNVAKNEQESNPTNTLDDMLYYAVLGGNHGSFGAITHVFLSPLRDAEYQQTSVFYECDWSFNPMVLRNMLVTMQHIYDETHEFNRVNVDYGFYIRTLKGEPWGNVVKLLGSFVSTSGASFNATYFERLIDAANQIEDVECHPMFISPSEYLQGAIVDHVFDLKTYETRLQVSPLLLSDDFIAAYVERMGLLFSAPMYDGVNIYSDIVFAGGNFILSDPGDKRTAVGGSRPNLQVNTDVYYDENINANGKQITKQWINETWDQLMNTDTFGFGRIDARACDASFGNVNMTEVWPFYYGGSVDLYTALREIKTIMDTNDLFSNIFTLKPL
eukprot:225935_1